jgi:muramidase (phage lysozyme)
MSNLEAFLDLISYSEGTYGKGDNGYNVLVGGKLFEGYEDHPRVRVYLPRYGVYSTAAGRYQILARIYDAYKARLSLTNFSPASQDAIAVRLLKERKALPAIEEGRLYEAVLLAAPVWASFPGAGYGQRENTNSALRDAFLRFGGTVSDA